MKNTTPPIVGQPAAGPFFFGPGVNYVLKG